MKTLLSYVWSELPGPILSELGFFGLWDYDQHETVDFLIAQGITRKEAQSAPYGAVSHINQALLERLLRLGAILHPSGLNVDNPILAANDPVMVRFLTRHGVDMTLRLGRNPHTGQTLLGRAVADRNLPLVGCLLTNGADVNEGIDGGSTALMTSADNDNVDILKLLLRHRPKVNARTVRGITALWNAVQSGRPKNVALLLRYGADPDMPDQNRVTPLTPASENPEPRMARMLLGPGTRVNAVNNAGETALDCAAKQGNSNVVAVLKRAGGRTGPSRKRTRTIRTDQTR